MRRLLQLDQQVTPTTVCSTAASFCRGLTNRELRTDNSQLTAGQRLYRQLGLTGARGEAGSGLSTSAQPRPAHYLTLLDQGLDPELALLDTLLLLMAIDGDTNVASRGGGGPALATARGANIIAKRGHSNPPPIWIISGSSTGVYRTKSQSRRQCRPAILTRF